MPKNKTMPEAERESSFDPEEEVVWDSDRDLPMWNEGSGDNEIGGYAPCESL